MGIDGYSYVRDAGAGTGEHFPFGTVFLGMVFLLLIFADNLSANEIDAAEANVIRLCHEDNEIGLRDYSAKTLKKIRPECRGNLLQYVIQSCPLSARVFKYLLDKGLSPYEPNSLDLTAVDQAVIQKNFKRLDDLKASGVDFTKPNHLGRLPVHFAIEFGDSNMVRYFLDQLDTFEGQLAPESLCCYARAAHNFPVLAYLSERFSGSLTTGQYKATPLKVLSGTAMNIPRESIASTGKIRKGRKGKGLQVSSRASDESGKTPLHLAAEAGDMARINSLFGRGTEINLPDSEGHTPPMLAAASGRLGALAFFLNRCFDDKLTDRLGQTIAHLAAQNGQMDILKMLDRKQFTLFSTDHSGCSLLHHGIRGGHQATIEWILEKQKWARAEDLFAGHPASRAILHLENPIPVLDALKSHGFSVHRESGSGFTNLHYAVVSGNKPTVEYLVKTCENVDTYAHLTPLHLAQLQHWDDIADFLEASGGHCENPCLESGTKDKEKTDRFLEVLRSEIEKLSPAMATKMKSQLYAPSSAATAEE